MPPLLFSLFVNDMWEYFQALEIRGINIDGYNDILVLVYVNDLVLLCNSPVDIRKKLKILQVYCAINYLEVNTQKTKFLEFHKGRAKKVSFPLIMNKLKKSQVFVT